MKNNDFYNHEGYPDPTAYHAIKNAERDDVSELIKEIKLTVESYDFEIVARIKLKDRRTGKVYK